MNVINPLQALPDAASFAVGKIQGLIATVQSTVGGAATTVLSTLDHVAERAVNAVAFVDLSDLTIDDEDDW